MQQLFGSLTTVANQTDVLGDSAFRPSITNGNRDLQPETVDTFNIGASWAPTDGFLEGFQFDVDYYKYKYKDIIGREASAAILLADNQALQAAVRGGQTLVQAIAAGVGNRRQVIRNGDGFLLRILPDFVNSEEADIDGIDITASYRFDTDFGMFRVGVQAAWAKTYDVTSGTQKFDAIGEYNEFTPVARPLPEWKINGTLSWSMDNHRAFMLVQYVDSLDYGVDLATDPRAGAARFWRETVALVHGADTAADFFTRNIKSMTTVDLHYTYSFNEFSFLNSTEVTVGAKNVFDKEPPWIPVNTAYDGTLHDMRGRVWFLRVSTSM
jgi:outer membrane receptor protein involved in Fe transport